MKELYRKKQELKGEQAQFEYDRKKFERMENEYNEFIKEKKRIKQEKKDFHKKQKFLAASTEKKSKMQLIESQKLEQEKEELASQKHVFRSKLSKHESRVSMHSSVNSAHLLDQREYKELKKKVIMYQDQIDSLENQNKILKRKLIKRDKFANDFAQDMKLNKGNNNQNTKYLISTLRAKVIELQNKNKLLSKLIKRHKNVNDAYNNVRDLKDNKTAEFQFESMETEQISSLYQSMKQKISELLLKTEELEETLQDKESEILKFESYANEWDIKHKLGEDRDKALYGKLRMENETLQQKLDVVYQQLEQEKATAATWQHTIEDKLNQSDNIQVGQDEKMLLINQLKQENKKLETQLEFNKGI